METVTPISLSASHSMMSGRRSVAFVVRLNSIRFPSSWGAAAGVGHRVLEHGEVEQRLPSEEGEVRDLDGAGLLEEELHAFPRGLVPHELRVVRARGVDDLVFAVLVAVRAGEIALVRDVEDHRREREAVGRQVVHDLFGGSPRLPDGANLLKFEQPIVYAVDGIPVGERVHDLARRAGAVAQQVEDRGGRRIDPEDAGRGHEVEKPLACRLEGVEFAQRQLADRFDHGTSLPAGTPCHGSNLRYSGTVTMRWARARRLSPPAGSAPESA